MLAAHPGPPGRLIDIGGRRLHVVESGSGPVSVVLESGAGGWSSHWCEVAPLLSSRARVIAYDRAGLGWSDPASGSRDAGHIVEDLDRLLAALGIDGPLVLVGHSLGGSFVRLATAQLGERVVGVVFVDAWHESVEEWEARTGHRVGMPAWLTTAYGWMGKLGVLGLLARVGTIPPSPWPIDAETWRDIHVVSASRRQCIGTEREDRGLPVGDRLVSAVTRIAAPIRVLVARESMPADEAPPGFPAGEYNATWLAAADKLAALSPSAQITVLDDSDHMIPFRRPDTVAAAVEQLLSLAAKR